MKVRRPIEPPRPSRRTVLAAVGGLTAIGSLGGCRTGPPPPVDFSEGARNFLAEDYRRIFDRWTRHERLVSADEGAIIEVWATLKSWEFREAYIEKYAEAYNLSRSDKAALREAQLEKARSVYEFHLTVQTTDSTWNDLDDRESTWRISLSDGTGDEIYPEEIDRLRLPAPYELVFFPERTAFSRPYRVVFEKPEAPSAGFSGPVSGELILKVTGPMGGVDMRWLAR